MVGPYFYMRACTSIVLCPTSGNLVAIEFRGYRHLSRMVITIYTGTAIAMWYRAFASADKHLGELTVKWVTLWGLFLVEVLSTLQQD